MLGAIIGDIIGSIYEHRNIKTKDFELFSSGSTFTDDTVLTIAIADSLINKKNYSESLQEYFWKYPNAGYGQSFIDWAFNKMNEPYNSWGNGSAMRVSPIGWFCDSLEEVLEQSKASAEVTHNHPEGIKGAQAVASAVFLARTGENKETIKNYLQEKFLYNLNYSLDEIRPDYQFDVSCQGSVPQALVAFLEAKDFEDTIRNAVSLGGDSDTIACISGSIAHAYFKEIPEKLIKDSLSRLTPELLYPLFDFAEKYPESFKNYHVWKKELENQTITKTNFHQIEQSLLIKEEPMSEVLQNTAKINSLKQEAKSIISQIAETVRIIDPKHSLLEECLSTQESFDEEQMVISVVGEFSRGKSCFLNSLLGEKVLTEADMPTTATITKLKYGEKPRMIVKFKNGKEKPIPEDNEADIDPKEFPMKLSDYTSELSKEYGGNKGKVSELIKEVICEYPNKVLKEGITIVDTPGVKALISGHKEMTEEQVKKSNAAICLFSCDQVGANDGEIEFLTFVKKEMGGNPNKLLYLANKMFKAQEAVDKNQSEKRNYLEQKNHYLDKFKDSIQSYIGINRDEINIFGYDSEWSFSKDEQLKEKGGFYQITHFIDQVLTSDQQVIESHLNDPLQRTQRLRDRVKEIVEKRLEQLNNPQDLDTLNKNLEEFKEKEEALKVQMESKVNFLKANLKQIEETLERRFTGEIISAIKDFQHEQLKPLVDSVLNKASYQIALEQIKDFDHQIKEIIDDLLTNSFQKELENKLKEYGNSVFDEVDQMKYFTKEDIEDLLKQITTEINLDNKFGFGELAEFENIMENFEKKKEEIETNIFKLQGELPFKAAQAAEIDKQIQHLDDQKKLLEFQITNSHIPEPNQRKKIKYVEIKKQGVFGFFFGPNWDYTVKEPEEYYEEDYSNVERFEKTIEGYHNKISAITDKIANLNGKGTGINNTNVQIQQNQQILNNLIIKQQETQKTINDYWATVRQRLTIEIPSRLRILKNRLNNLKTNKIDKVLRSISKDISKITNQKIQAKLDDVSREINRLKEDQQKGEQELLISRNFVNTASNNLEKIDIEIKRLEQQISELLTDKR